MMKTWFS